MDDILKVIAEKYHIEESIIKDIDLYLQQVIHWNKFINLTAISDLYSARIIHIEDSLVGYIPNLFNNANTYADIGSGCGFPGVALGIVSKLETKLIDSSKKKMNVVKQILSDQSIKKIQTIDQRIEEVSNSGTMFDVVSARALSSLPVILELASPLVNLGGFLIVYKASFPLNEIKEFDPITEAVGFTFVDVYNAELLDQKGSRSVLIYQKDHQSKIPLPRKNGLAQKRPLKATDFL